LRRKAYLRRKPLRRLSRATRDSIAARIGWALTVKKRDGRCQGDGCRETFFHNLEAHHVYPKGRYPDLRLVADNGLTLCADCHKAWHRATRLHKRWWEAKWPVRAAYVKSLIDAKEVVDRGRNGA